MTVAELENVAIPPINIDVFGTIYRASETSEWDDYEVNTLEIFDKELWITLGGKVK